jgi:hypothetical protein
VLVFNGAGGELRAELTAATKKQSPHRIALFRASENSIMRPVGDLA